MSASSSISPFPFVFTASAAAGAVAVGLTAGQASGREARAEDRCRYGMSTAAVRFLAALDSDGIGSHESDGSREEAVGEYDTTSAAEAGPSARLGGQIG